MTATLVKTGRQVPVATCRKNKPPISASVSERIYSAEEANALREIDRFKRENRKPWPTWMEILYVFKEMGYRHPDYD